MGITKKSNKEKIARENDRCLSRSIVSTVFKSLILRLLGGRDKSDWGTCK